MQIDIFTRQSHHRSIKSISAVLLHFSVEVAKHLLVIVDVIFIPVKLYALEVGLSSKLLIRKVEIGHSIYLVLAHRDSEIESGTGIGRRCFPIGIFLRRPVGGLVGIYIFRLVIENLVFIYKITVTVEKHHPKPVD